MRKAFVEHLGNGLTRSPWEREIPSSNLGCSTKDFQEVLYDILVMSRSLHYRFCEKCRREQVCPRHEWRHEELGDKYSWYVPKNETPQGEAKEILGRRNWKRKPRWPWFSIKSFISPPPRWWWHEAHAKARQKYKQMMLRSEDPALPRERDLIDLWGWY